MIGISGTPPLILIIKNLYIKICAIIQIIHEKKKLFSKNALLYVFSAFNIKTKIREYRNCSNKGFENAFVMSD